MSPRPPQPPWDLVIQLQLPLQAYSSSCSWCPSFHRLSLCSLNKPSPSLPRAFLFALPFAWDRFFPPDFWDCFPCCTAYAHGLKYAFPKRGLLFLQMTPLLPHPANSCVFMTVSNCRILASILPISPTAQNLREARDCSIPAHFCITSAHITNHF